MSWLSSFLSPGKGYQKGQEQLDKYWGQAQNYYNQGQGYLDPFRQQGQAAYGDLTNTIQSFLHPEELQDKWIKGYVESEAAKNAEARAQEHGLDVASSMGLMGSSPALNAIQAGTTQIGLDDRENYLNNLMQKYLTGAQMTQGLYGSGLNAAGNQAQNAMGMGQNAMNMGQNSAQMAYGQQNAGGNMLGGLLGQGIGLVGSALGGPIGGSLSKRWNLSGGA